MYRKISTTATPDTGSPLHIDLARRIVRMIHDAQVLIEGNVGSAALLMRQHLELSSRLLNQAG